jgi:hypothetical protein
MGDPMDAKHTSEIAAALGRLGGLRGGPARARKLTEAERQAIARSGGKARWARHRQAQAAAAKKKKATAKKRRAA